MRSSRVLFPCSALLLLLVSCQGGNDARVFQQITVLSEEVRATNGEVKLLRQEIDCLRKELAAQTGISPESTTASAPGGKPAKCSLPSQEAESSTKSQPSVPVVNSGEPEPGRQEGPSRERLPSSTD